MSEQKIKNIRNAFAAVKQVLSELGPLIQDFEAELDGLEPIHTGNEISSEPSKSLNHSDRWLPNYFVRYYAISKTDNSINWYAGAGMLHCKHNYIPFPPLFLIGVIKKERSNLKDVEPWWLTSLYDAEQERIFKNEKGEKLADVKNETWTEVIPYFKNDKDGLKWYDMGYVYPKILTDIENKEDVAELAKNLSDKFKILTK